MADADVDGKLASLVDITDALLRGQFDHDGSSERLFDTEGVLATLAKKINKMVVNMKTIEAPLANAGEYAPSVVSNAQSVIELMSQSTGEVLNKSDKLVMMSEKLETLLAEGDTPGERAAVKMLPDMKEAIYDIIASQSFQDVASQKMAVMVSELNQMRDWLVETLVVLNINKDSSETLQEKKKLLKEAKETVPDGPLSQDLVDDLLAEFGL